MFAQHSPYSHRRVTVPVLLCASLLPFVLLNGCKKAENAVQEAQGPPVSVKTETATLLEIPRRLQLTGTLRGARETELAANVAGRITKTGVERGQRVEEGDILAKVDIQAAQLVLAEAQVQVQTSETQEKINLAECERYEKLKKSGVVTELEYDKVTAKCKTAPLALKSARARRSIAAKNVGDGLIRAAFSGTITERYVEVGEYVQPSSRVVSLAQVDELRIVFAVPEKNYPDVKVGAEVNLRVSAYDERSFLGTVAHISGAVRATLDFVVEANIPNPKGELVPGMFADVQLTIGTEKHPSTLSSAIFEQNGKKNILVAVDGQVQQRVVAVLPAVGERTPILRGLAEGDNVITENIKTLKNGQRIQ